MPVFIVSHIATRQRKIMPYVGMLRSSSKEEAEAAGNRKLEQGYPVSEGWVHSSTAEEITKATLEMMIKDAR